MQKSNSDKCNNMFNTLVGRTAGLQPPYSLPDFSSLHPHSMPAAPCRVYDCTEDIRPPSPTPLIPSTIFHQHVDGLMQGRCNSSALAMEWRLFCTDPSMCTLITPEPPSPCAAPLSFPTYWGLNNMATILQMTFSNIFSWKKKVSNFYSNFTEVCSLRVQLVIINPHQFRQWLVVKKWQPFIVWHNLPSLSHNELTHWPLGDLTELLDT